MDRLTLRSTFVSDRPDRVLVIAQLVLCALMLGAAVLAGFPGVVPLLFLAGAIGAVNTAFAPMRTFGSVVLAGTAATSVALAAVPFVTCSSDRFTDVFSCTGDAPVWQLTGATIATALSAAGLVLARTAVRVGTEDRLTRIEARLDELCRQLATDDVIEDAAEDVTEDSAEDAVDDTDPGETKPPDDDAP